MQEPALVLYTDSSPNGFKITIALEELELPYRLVHVNIDLGEHRQADFLALNPAGRIPVLADHEAGIVLFESAAILLYLAQHSGQLLEQATQPRWEAITWLMYHSASMGPLLGQRVHFECFEAQPDLVAQKRYRTLTEDAFALLDVQLATRQWLAGEAYSIADIASFAWLHIAAIVGFDFSAYSNLCRWYRQVEQRPAVQRGIRLPAPATGP
ncbi:glutathione S-transferase family protein [Pseudomonas sp. zjy_11]|uniref:glutathione S-transferase family protein n=2 Tax=Pseudomonas TaxID=286 RepID=UPI003709D8FF